MHMKGEKKMIKKSLLLLALLCGSAAAVAPGTVSKTSVDDFLKIAEKANEVRNYAMNEDAGLELMEESVVLKNAILSRFLMLTSIQMHSVLLKTDVKSI